MKEFNIIIYALSIKIGGEKKITLKLQIYKYINDTSFFLFFKVKFFNYYVYVLYDFEHYKAVKH